MVSFASNGRVYIKIKNLYYIYSILLSSRSSRSTSSSASQTSIKVLELSFPDSSALADSSAKQASASSSFSKKSSK